MTEDKAAEKTVQDKVTDPEAAPKEGVEREDAQPTDQKATEKAAADQAAAEKIAAQQASDEPGSEVAVGGASYEGRVRTGMWSDGPGDTSGYGRITRVVAPPQATEPPLGSWFDEATRRLAVLVQDPIVKAVVAHGELTLYVPREKIVEILQQLRDDAQLRFESFSGVSGVHYPEATGEEFHVVYHLQSMTHNRRIRVEATVPDADPHIPSVVSVYPAADWHERETWDMFGVIFDGHPSLTRILMPDDWVGHPQRKDYPLGGIPVEYKGAVVAPPDQRRQYR